MLTVQEADVLGTAADALVVPIDGTFTPGPEQFERLLGNVGRQFVRRFPEVDLLERLEAQLDLPLGLGQAAVIDLGDAVGAPFRSVVVVSTLHHAEHLDERAKRAVARQSFSSALVAADRARARSVATPVLQGGWRLSPEIAFTEMLHAAGAPPLAHLDVLVCCIDAALAERFRGMARSLGFGAR